VSCRTVVGPPRLDALSSQLGGGLGPKRRLTGFEVRKEVEKILGKGAGIVSRHDSKTNVTEQALYFTGTCGFGLPESR
jgi:hypothetical protein